MPPPEPVVSSCAGVVTPSYKRCSSDSRCSRGNGVLEPTGGDAEARVELRVLSASLQPFWILPLTSAASRRSCTSWPTSVTPLHSHAHVHIHIPRKGSNGFGIRIMSFHCQTKTYQHSQHGAWAACPIRADRCPAGPTTARWRNSSCRGGLGDAGRRAAADPERAAQCGAAAATL